MGWLRKIEFKLSHRQECFCAFCKSSRKVYFKKRINFLNILLAAVASIILMYAFFQDFDPRVLLLFVVLLAVAEAFVQLRWRLNIICPECGFDPALYARDAAKAAEKVKGFLAKRAEQPGYLLRAPLRLPVQKRQPAKTLAPRDKKSLMI